jgi:hypothetical protein
MSTSRLTDRTPLLEEAPHIRQPILLGEALRIVHQVESTRHAVEGPGARRKCFTESYLGLPREAGKRSSRRLRELCQRV